MAIYGNNGHQKHRCSCDTDTNAHQGSLGSVGHVDVRVPGAVAVGNPPQGSQAVSITPLDRTSLGGT